MSVATRQTWLPAKTAANRLGTTVYRVLMKALAGEIRFKIESCETPRFHADDIDRLAAEQVSEDATT